MVGVGRFVGELKATGVEFFAGVPDSLLKSFCAYVTDTNSSMGSDPMEGLKDKMTWRIS